MIANKNNEPISDFLLKLSKILRKAESKGWNKLEAFGLHLKGKISEAGTNLSTAKSKADSTLETIITKAKEKGEVMVFMVKDINFEENEIIGEILSRNDDDETFKELLKRNATKAAKEVSEIVEKVENKLEETAEKVEDWAEDTRDKLEETVSEAKKAATTKKEEIKEKLSETSLSTNKLFKEIFETEENGVNNSVTILIGKTKEDLNVLDVLAKEKGCATLNLSTSTAKSPNGESFLKESKTALELWLEEDENEARKIVLVNATDGSAQGLNSLVTMFSSETRNNEDKMIVAVNDEKKVFAKLKETSSIL